jgi:hypothetical protein
MEFYSATKTNDFLPFASKRMELEDVILSEVKMYLYSLQSKRSLAHKKGLLWFYHFFKFSIHCLFKFMSDDGIANIKSKDGLFWE